jgi:hypothetical protein
MQLAKPSDAAKPALSAAKYAQNAKLCAQKMMKRKLVIDYFLNNRNLMSLTDYPFQ